MRKSISARAKASGALAAASILVVAAAARPAQEAWKEAPFRTRLKNGLEVILSENPALPVVAVVVAYGVGSIHEPPGKTGLAYLMEKLMMDAGAEHVAPFQHINDVSQAGGMLNADAFEDRTLFYQAVPSNQLARVLWLEAERMRAPAISGESFERVKDDLEGQRRRRAIEPYQESLAAFDRLIFADDAYSHPVLGNAADAGAVSLEDTKAFASAYYTPTNAVLCVAGDFNREKALDLIAGFFESIPRGREIPPAAENWTYTRRPVERSIDEPLAPSPALFIGYRLALPHTNDYYTLVLLDYLLLRGRSSRLPRRLLNPDNKIAYQLNGGLEIRRDRAVYKIFVTASSKMIPECRRAILAELDRLKQNHPAAAELVRAKTLFRQNLIERTSASLDRAIHYAESALSLRLLGRTVEALPDEQAKVLAVTAADVVGIAARYFQADNGVFLDIRR
jgi:predicted Zn-dependent peptidase